MNRLMFHLVVGIVLTLVATAVDAVREREKATLEQRGPGHVWRSYTRGTGAGLGGRAR